MSISINLLSPNCSNVHGPIATRWRCVTSLPTARSIRLTWWNFPSVKISSNKPSSRTDACAGKVLYPSSRITHQRKRASCFSVTGSRVVTKYVFGRWCFGEMMRWLSCPSLVARISHSVSTSSLHAIWTIAVYGYASRSCL